MKVDPMGIKTSIDVSVSELAPKCGIAWFLPQFQLKPIKLNRYRWRFISLINQSFNQSRRRRFESMENQLKPMNRRERIIFEVNLKVGGVPKNPNPSLRNRKMKRIITTTKISPEKHISERRPRFPWQHWTINKNVSASPENPWESSRFPPTLKPLKGSINLFPLPPFLQSIKNSLAAFKMWRNVPITVGNLRKHPRESRRNSMEIVIDLMKIYVSGSVCGKPVEKCMREHAAILPCAGMHPRAGCFFPKDVVSFSRLEIESELRNETAKSVGGGGRRGKEGGRLPAFFSLLSDSRVIPEQFQSSSMWKILRKSSWVVSDQLRRSFKLRQYRTINDIVSNEKSDPSQQPNEPFLTRRDSNPLCFLIFQPNLNQKLPPPLEYIVEFLEICKSQSFSFPRSVFSPDRFQWICERSARETTETNECRRAPNGNGVTDNNMLIDLLIVHRNKGKRRRRRKNKTPWTN